MGDVSNPYLVNRGRLDTATTSQSGTILTNGSVVVAMDPYSFFPDFEGDWQSDGTTGIHLHTVNIASPSADSDAPQVELWNQSGVTEDYGAAWRYVVA